MTSSHKGLVDTGTAFTWREAFGALVVAGVLSVLVILALPYAFERAASNATAQIISQAQADAMMINRSMTFTPPAKRD